MKAKLTNPKGEVVIPDPPIARLLFSSTKLAWLWVIVRLYLGYQWINAGLHKVEGDGWVNNGGAALKGFWTSAVKIPEQGKPPIAFDWYRDFIQGMLDSGSYSWFAKLVAVGEVLVGVALIVGLFVGIAAFFGAFMNWNFMLAGSASTNPVLMVAAIFLVLAWKTAGYWGLDRFVLPIVGTPWQWLNKRQAAQTGNVAPAPSA